MNRPRYKGASVLIARANFGCGSSREHAPWAILDYGFRAILAPSYADIFYNNCFQNGILPATLSNEQIDELFKRTEKNEGYKLTVDLEQQTVSDDQGLRYSFEIDPFRKECLLKGLDNIGLSLVHEPEISAFEKQAPPRAGDERAARREIPPQLAASAVFGSPYFFSAMSTEARVVSQSRRMVQRPADLSKAMVKFSSGAGSLRDFHRDAREVEFLPGIRNAPLAGLLADDKRPLVRRGKREERVAAGGDRRLLHEHGRVDDEGGGFIRAGAPLFAIGHQVAENLSPAHAGARVVHVNRLAVGESAGRLRRRAQDLAALAPESGRRPDRRQQQPGKTSH